MDEELINLQLTASELNLLVRLAEANDSGGPNGSRRIGAIRTRTSLQSKLYSAKDALGEAAGADDDD